MAWWVFSLSALVPTLSAWVASTHGQAVLAEICSVKSGAKGNADAVVTPEGSGGPQAKHGHCPFCLLQDHNTAPPPVSQAFSPVVFEAVALLPSLFLRSPRTLHAWSPLAARGPPSLT
jgi:Protein of unknown function (DUF2946)